MRDRSFTSICACAASCVTFTAWTACRVGRCGYSLPSLALGWPDLAVTQSNAAPSPELLTLTQCHPREWQGPSLPGGFTFCASPGTWCLYSFPSGKVWETLKHLPRDGHHPPAAPTGNFPTLGAGLWLGWGQHSPGTAAPLEWGLCHLHQACKDHSRASEVQSHPGHKRGFPTPNPNRPLATAEPTGDPAAMRELDTAPEANTGVWGRGQQPLPAPSQQGHSSLLTRHPQEDGTDQDPSPGAEQQQSGEHAAAAALRPTRSVWLKWPYL